MAEARQSPAVTRRQPIPSQAHELPRCHIEQDGACFWQLFEIGNTPVEFNCATELAQISRERIRNRLRATPRERPANRVSRHAKHKPKRSRSDSLQWKECMRRHTGEERARFFTLERELRQHFRRQKRGSAETSELEGMFRQMKDRLEDFVREIFPIAHQRSHQAAVAGIMQRRRRFINITVQRRRSPSVERMC